MQSIILTVEDGTMPEGSNTYASLDDFHAWIRQRQPEYVIDADNADKEASWLIRGFDALNGYDYYGRKAAPMRIPAFPRVGMKDREGYHIPANAVPPQIKEANCVLAWLAGVDEVDLQPMLERGGRVSGEGVGPLNSSLFEDAANRDVSGAVADLLAGLARGFERFSGVGLNNPAGGVSMGRVVR